MNAAASIHRPLAALYGPVLVRWGAPLLALLVALVATVPAPAAAAVKDPDSPTILITGSNRGVGLALAREYADKGWNVIATSRRPKEAKELQALARANPKVILERLDVTEDDDIRALKKKYQGVPIDVLFNNAALLGAVPKQQFGNLSEDEFEQVMETNVLGPLKLAEALVDNVAASRQKKIIGMTSGLGSLTLMGRMSRFYYYQMSKAALNMGFRALRNDLKPRGIIVALLAPGMVETDLLHDSGYRGEALTPAESAAGLYKLVEGLTLEDKGVPINVDGKPIPW
jgi:NAD(P)-dependent dehydrogenase (short-subunit alcohol dehydrogenase family)